MTTTSEPSKPFEPFNGQKGGQKGGKGQKRPFNATGDLDAKRPRHDSAKKEAAKEANAALRAQLEEEYTRVASEIAPLVSSIIDSYGGVTTLGLVSQNPEIIAEMERIPEGHSKKLKKILDLYPDYIVSLTDGMIATAMGYENGTVSSDGVVDKEAMSKNHKQKKENDKALGIVSQQPPNQAKPQGGAASPQAMERLNRACDKIARVGKLPNPQAFNSALQELQAARELVFKTGAHPANPNQPGACQKEINAFTSYVRRFMVGKGLEAGMPMRFCELASDNEAKQLHSNIGGGKRCKMSRVLEDASEFFVLHRTEESNELTVALTEKGTQVNAQKNRRPFTKGKGKGKGPRA